MVPFADARHYYQTAKAWGQLPGHIWTNQFENLCNGDAHFTSTQAGQGFIIVVVPMTN